VNKKNSADGGMTNYSIAYCGNNISYLLVQSWLNKSVIDMNFISDGYLVILCSAREMCLAEDKKICFQHSKSEKMIIYFCSYVFVIFGLLQKLKN